MDKQEVSEKEYDVDNEPVFPVCGTCNAQKDLTKGELKFYDKPDVAEHINNSINKWWCADNCTCCREEATKEILSIIEQEKEEALSARDKEWREKIENLQGKWISVAETYCPDWVLDLRYILSEMGKEGE